jgi:hypothetical protein
MTDTTNTRLAGVLSRIAAAGHTTRQVEIETPDGASMTLTMIDAGRALPRWQARQPARHRARSE